MQLFLPTRQLFKYETFNFPGNNLRTSIFQFLQLFFSHLKLT